MAEKFCTNETNSAGDDVVKGDENSYESEQKRANDSISLQSNQTDRSSAAQRSHRNTGK